MQDYICDPPNRDAASLKELKNNLTSYQFNRLDRSLQTALSAERNGADIELIVAALNHDIADALAPENLSLVFATIIQPFSRDEVIWILQMHGLFHVCYYVNKLNLEKDGRDIYSERKLFNAAMKFCQKWNQIPFVPECQKRN